jgi:hypothetical protein
MCALTALLPALALAQARPCRPPSSPSVVRPLHREYDRRFEAERFALERQREADARWYAEQRERREREQSDAAARTARYELVREQARVLELERLTRKEAADREQHLRAEAQWQRSVEEARLAHDALAARNDAYAREQAETSLKEAARLRAESAATRGNEVYHWVDADGVEHFSTRPASQ